VRCMPGREALPEKWGSVGDDPAPIPPVAYFYTLSLFALLGTFLFLLLIAAKMHVPAPSFDRILAPAQVI